MFIWILAHSSPFSHSFNSAPFLYRETPLRLALSHVSRSNGTPKLFTTRWWSTSRNFITRNTSPGFQGKNTFLENSDVFEVSAVEICPLRDTSIIPRETEYRVPLMDRSICLVANDMIIETLAGTALLLSNATFNDNRVKKKTKTKQA